MKVLNCYLNGTNWYVGDFYEDKENGIKGVIDLTINILSFYPLYGFFSETKLNDNEFVNILTDFTKEELQFKYKYMKPYLKRLKTIRKIQKKLEN